MLKKIVIAMVTLLVLAGIIRLSIYVNSDNYRKLNQPGQQLFERKECRVCHQKIAATASSCPHCGDSPANVVILLYSMAGFALLLGLQILQCQIARSEKKYLYFLAMVSTCCFLGAALFNNPLETDNFFSLPTVIGFFFLFLVITHLSYVVLLPSTSKRAFRKPAKGIAVNRE